MAHFDAYNDCRKELFSLNDIVKYIETNVSSNSNIYNTICNGNIIILGTLFESFSENIIQEYIDEIIKEFNNGNILFSSLPEEMKKYISQKMIYKYHRRDFDTMHQGETQNMICKFLVSLGNNPFIIDDELDDINRFNFGKHGQTELTKLFKRVGIKLEETFESFDELNNYFVLRNGIVHPASISFTISSPTDIDDIKKYLKYLFFYIRQIDCILNKELEKF